MYGLIFITVRVIFIAEQCSAYKPQHQTFMVERATNEQQKCDEKENTSTPHIPHTLQEGVCMDESHRDPDRVTM